MKKVVLLAVSIVAVVVMFFVSLKSPENEKVVVELKEEHSVSFEERESAVNYKPEGKEKEVLETDSREGEVEKRGSFDVASLEGLTEQEARERVLEAISNCNTGKSDCTKITYNIQH